MAEVLRWYGATFKARFRHHRSRLFTFLREYLCIDCLCTGVLVASRWSRGLFRTSALDSLDMALSLLAVKSLDVQERGDTLLKRAELKMAMDERGPVDSALTDLIESVKLNSKNFKAFCLLGKCYEAKKMKEEARTAYEEALKVEPQSTVAQEALSRLGS